MTDSRKERGDWQTPVEFAKQCCEVLKGVTECKPAYILEPTCGVGNFIEAARSSFPEAMVCGVELDATHCETARNRFSSDSLTTIVNADFLQSSNTKLSTHRSPELILGNPPWVTNSTLSALGSTNIPQKQNFKGLRGIDAMTGESNFDICEWIILKSLSLLGGRGMLAMLCKTSVARSACIELAKVKASASCFILEFNSKKVFGINAAACFLIVDYGASKLEIKLGQIENPKNLSPLAYNGKTLVQKLPEKLIPLQGECELQWRQGVKHDCSKVMELTSKDGVLVNKLGETVLLEDEMVFPYVKSSKSRLFEIATSESFIPMTQKRIGEETQHLEHDAPLLWHYLSEHSAFFEARKSSIYKNAPSYAMFGVGDYSYSPYKVAVSGFYKDPVFSIAHGEKPIMFDDTCYFIPFEKESDARVCMLLLNSTMVKRYYSSIAFLDSKRPYSKKVLSQLNLKNAIRLVGLDGLNSTAESIGVNFRVSLSDFDQFCSLITKSLF